MTNGQLKLIKEDAACEYCFANSETDEMMRGRILVWFFSEAH